VVPEARDGGDFVMTTILVRDARSEKLLGRFDVIEAAERAWGLTSLGRRGRLSLKDDTVTLFFERPELSEDEDTEALAQEADARLLGTKELAPLSAMVEEMLES
jgi:hypothetical protein